MYDPTLYNIDCLDQEDENASIKRGALLYRITSLTHWRKGDVLSGEGPMIARNIGRFHIVDQRTSYCANNIMISLAEVLYHMYRKVLDGIKNNHAPAHLATWAKIEYRLVILSVDDIDDLVYVDASGARIYDPRIVSSTIVFPDPIYGPLHELSNNLRMANKRGIVYPSARHSKDFAFAFFKDETAKIRSSFYEVPYLTLQLIAENQDVGVPPRKFKPIKEKLHATMGYYEFKDSTNFADLKGRKLIYPEDLPVSGYIDFVRRRYNNYPRDAFLP